MSTGSVCTVKDLSCRLSRINFLCLNRPLTASTFIILSMMLFIVSSNIYFIHLIFKHATENSTSYMTVNPYRQAAKTSPRLVIGWEMCQECLNRGVANRSRSLLQSVPIVSTTTHPPRYPGRSPGNNISREAAT